MSNIVIRRKTGADRPLTKREHLFVAAFVAGKKPTEAAVAAGYSKGTARCASGEILRRPRVANAIEEARRPVLAEAKVSLRSHLDALKRLRDEARDQNQYGAAVRAEYLRGVAAGVYLSAPAMTDAQLAGLTGQGADGDA